jgi:ribosomal protein S18 acetylase RimI-like enzyme
MSADRPAPAGVPAAGSAAGAGGIRVRPARPEDVARVWELLRGLADYEKLTAFVTGTPDLLHAALFGGAARAECLVAEHGGRLVGYALYYPVFGSFRARWRMWLEDLYVEPELRGSGAGARMLAELARIALARGYYAVDWEVLDWNQPAIGFYQRHGAGRVATDWCRYRLDGEALKALADRPAPGR